MEQLSKNRETLTLRGMLTIENNYEDDTQYLAIDNVELTDIIDKYDLSHESVEITIRRLKKWNQKF